MGHHIREVMERVEKMETNFQSQISDLHKIIRRQKINDINNCVIRFNDWEEDSKDNVKYCKYNDFDSVEVSYNLHYESIDKHKSCTCEQLKIGMILYGISKSQTLVSYNDKCEEISRIWRKCFPYHDLDHILKTFESVSQELILNILCYENDSHDNSDYDSDDEYTQSCNLEVIRKNDFKRFMKLSHNDKLYYTNEDVEMLIYELDIFDCITHIEPQHILTHVLLEIRYRKV